MPKGKGYGKNKGSGKSGVKKGWPTQFNYAKKIKHSSGSR